MGLHEKVNGVHPLKVFFACVGGCIGIGNIVGVCTAVQIGGPGALFWVWVTALLGVMIKYGEVYLGVRHRVPALNGGYHGGPMYFLRKVFKRQFFPNLVCMLLCIYGVEIFQFNVVAYSVSTNLEWNYYAVVSVLLVLVIFASSGGVKRVGNISSMIIPLFVIVYLSMGFWVLIQNYTSIPHVMYDVFTSAFTGHSAIGGFVGSTIMMAMSNGIRRGAYSGDVGIGYASVIHSETQIKEPQKQASLVIFDIFLDTFAICTMSVLIIVVTDVWHQPVEPSHLVQIALQQYFPHMNIFMPFFLFLLGYSTINAYFVVGLSCAEYLLPKHGRKLYYVYACFALILFSFLNSSQALSVMSIIGCSLLIINSYGIYKLRKEINYDID